MEDDLVAGSPMVGDLSGALLACAICGEAFTSISALDNHLDTQHNPYGNDTLVSCGFCGELFTLLHYLEEHVANTHGDQPVPVGPSAGLYACVGCDIRFNDIVILTEHLKTHSGSNDVVEDPNSQQEDQGRSHNLSLGSDADLECLMSDDNDIPEQKPNIADIRVNIAKRQETVTLGNQISVVTVSQASVIGENAKINKKESQESNCTVQAGHSSDPVGNNFPKGPPKRNRGRPRKDGGLLLKENYCEICNTVFAMRLHLLEHKRDFHSMKIFTCSVCSEGYLSRYLLDRHIFKDHSMWGNVQKETATQDRPKKMAAQNTLLTKPKPIHGWVTTEVKRGRGRPRKDPLKAGRGGRPRKEVKKEYSESETVPLDTPTPEPKRGRGRPRKEKVYPTNLTLAEEHSKSEEVPLDVPCPKASQINDSSETNKDATDTVANSRNDGENPTNQSLTDISRDVAESSRDQDCRENLMKRDSLGSDDMTEEQEKNDCHSDGGNDTVDEEHSESCNVGKENDESSNGNKEHGESCNVGKENDKSSNDNKEHGESCNVGKENDESSNGIKEHGESGNVGKENDKSSNDNKEHGESSDVSKEHDTSSDVDKEQGTTSNVSKEQGASSDVSKEHGKNSNVTQKLTEISEAIQSPAADDCENVPVKTYKVEIDDLVGEMHLENPGNVPDGQNEHVSRPKCVCMTCHMYLGNQFSLDCHILSEHRQEKEKGRGRPRKQQTCLSCGEHFSARYVYAAHVRVAHPEARRASCEERARGKSQSPRARALSQCTRAKAISQIPRSRAVSQSPEAKVLTQSPKARAFSRTPSGRFMPQSPEDRALSESFGVKDVVVEVEKMLMFSCAVCGMDFTKKCRLRDHMTTHDGEEEDNDSENTYDKMVEQFAIPDKTRLVQRLKLPKNLTLGTGKYGLTCKMCYHKFMRRCHLEEHIWTHTDQQPWQCQFCHVGFRREKQLALHMDQMHLDQVLSAQRGQHMINGEEAAGTSGEVTVKSDMCKGFACSVCGELLTSTGDLELHMLKHVNITAHTCVCGKKFKNRKKVIAHRSKCLVLLLKTRNKGKRTRAGPRPYKCTVCSKKFKRRCHVEEHMWTHESIRPYQCQFCNKSFTRPSVLAGHVMAKHGDRSDIPITKNIVPVVLNVTPDEGPSNDWEYVGSDDDCTNIDDYTNIKGFDPPEELTLKNVGRPARNRREYSNHFSLQCVVCKQYFASKHHVREHVWVHLSQKPYNCVFCPRGFNRHRALIMHLSRHNGVELDTASRRKVKRRKKKLDKKMKFECCYCNKGFASQPKLGAHLSVHAKVNDFKCAYCEETFDEQCDFQRHCLQHDEDRLMLQVPLGAVDHVPEPVQTPGRAYSTHRGVHMNGPALTYLKEEILQKKSERPYQCQECGKGFKMKAHLTEHAWIHMRKEGKNHPYKVVKSDVEIPSSVISYQKKKCLICKKTFNNVSHLKEHVWTHFQEKPYPCEFCPRGFVRASLLQRHMDIYHQPSSPKAEKKIKKRKEKVPKAVDQVLERRFKCYVCEQTFCSKDEVINHLQTHSEPFPEVSAQIQSTDPTFSAPVIEYDIDTGSTLTCPETLLEQECLDLMTPMDQLNNELDNGLEPGELEGYEPGEIQIDPNVMDHGIRPVIEIDRGIDSIIDIDGDEIPTTIHIDPDENTSTVRGNPTADEVMRVINIDPDSDNEDDIADSEKYPTFSMSSGNVIGQIIIQPDSD